MLMLFPPATVPGVPKMTTGIDLPPVRKQTRSVAGWRELLQSPLGEAGSDCSVMAGAPLSPSRLRSVLEEEDRCKSARSAAPAEMEAAERAQQASSRENIASRTDSRSEKIAPVRRDDGDARFMRFLPGIVSPKGCRAILQRRGQESILNPTFLIKYPKNVKTLKVF